MPADPYAKTRFRAAKHADEDLRRDEPWLWYFANVVTWAIHPWVSLRLWWMERSMLRTVQSTNSFRSFRG
jgi:hypothetical protein